MYVGLQTPIDFEATRFKGQCHFDQFLVETVSCLYLCQFCGHLHATLVTLHIHCRMLVLSMRVVVSNSVSPFITLWFPVKNRVITCQHYSDGYGVAPKISVMIHIVILNLQAIQRLKCGNMDLHDTSSLPLVSLLTASAAEHRASH